MKKTIEEVGSVWGWLGPTHIYIYGLALGGGRTTPKGYEGGSATPRPAKRVAPSFFFFFLFFIFFKAFKKKKKKW